MVDNYRELSEKYYFRRSSVLQRSGRLVPTRLVALGFSSILATQSISAVARHRKLDHWARAASAVNISVICLTMRVNLHTARCQRSCIFLKAFLSPEICECHGMW
jgi:hypothetical protein